MPNPFLQMLQNPDFWVGAAPALAQAGDPYAPNPILGAITGGQDAMAFFAQQREEEERQRQEEERRRQAEERALAIQKATLGLEAGPGIAGSIFGIENLEEDPILSAIMAQKAAAEAAEVERRQQELERITGILGSDPQALAVASELEGAQQDQFFREWYKSQNEPPPKPAPPPKPTYRTVEGKGVYEITPGGEPRLIIEAPPETPEPDSGGKLTAYQKAQLRLKAAETAKDLTGKIDQEAYKSLLQEMGVEEEAVTNRGLEGQVIDTAAEAGKLLTPAKIQEIAEKKGWTYRKALEELAKEFGVM